MNCTVPPKGWYCTREAGHDGPCAARSTGAYGVSDDNQYDKGYRDGYKAAAGHLPNCPRKNEHMQGATMCPGCGSELRQGGSGHNHNIGYYRGLR